MSNGNQLAVRNVAVTQKLSRAKAVYGQIIQFEAVFKRTSDSILRCVWELGSLLNELKLEPTGLESREPNLERVFLHLTGRELRD